MLCPSDNQGLCYNPQTTWSRVSTGLAEVFGGLINVPGGLEPTASPPSGFGGGISSPGATLYRVLVWVCVSCEALSNLHLESQFMRVVGSLIARYIFC